MHVCICYKSTGGNGPERIPLGVQPVFGGPRGRPPSREGTERLAKVYLF